MDYVINHSAVGQWRAGQIITHNDLIGCDVARLLALGAISEVEAPADSPEPEPELKPEPEPKPEPVAINQPPKRPDRRTLDELRAQAAKLGIAVEGLTRAELREAIASATTTEDRVERNV